MLNKIFNYNNYNKFSLLLYSPIPTFVVLRVHVKALLIGDIEILVLSQSNDGGGLTTRGGCMQWGKALWGRGGGGG